MQETLLRAWKAYDRFEGKSSMRTWLHRIATNTCLTALEGRRRRPLPTGTGRPQLGPDRRAGRRPRGALAGAAAGPDGRSGRPVGRSSGRASRCGWRLWPRCSTFHPGSGRCCCCATCCSGRPPRWPRRSVPPRPPSTACCSGPGPSWRPSGPAPTTGWRRRIRRRRRTCWTRYIAAFEAYDIDRLVELFTAEAIWEMPPYVGWYQGAAGHRHADSPAVPRRVGRRHAPAAAGRQRPARRRHVHARRRRARAVPVARAGRAAATGCRVWWHSSTTRCSRNSGCPVRCPVAHGGRFP